MKIVDIQEAQAHLEELIDELRPGESFVIAVDGKPRVKVTALTPDEIRRLEKGKE
jgi:antitoxin (DNA-binding transcriptional repressor) of toxin-antitoxin stability system